MLTAYAEKRHRRALARIHAYWTGGIDAGRVPARWERPLAGTGNAPLCLFVMLARAGRLLPHSIDLARAWKDAGFEVAAVVIVESLADPVDLAVLGFADAVLLRENIGYDFGAWAAAIRRVLTGLGGRPLLAIANDSVLGPSSAFPALIERVRQSPADVVGLVESNELAPHLQSFVLFFKPGALRSRVFARFWRSVRSGDRQYVIDNYEVPLRGRFQAAGLRVEALFPIPYTSWYNPSFVTWRQIVAAGFPFLKIELLRSHPWQIVLGDWRDHAARHGFDLARLDRQIAALEALSETPWAYREAS